MWEAHFQPDFIYGGGRWVYVYIEPLPTIVNRLPLVSRSVKRRRITAGTCNYPTGFP